METRREFLLTMSALPVVLNTRPDRPVPTPRRNDVRAQRLSWAGVKITGRETTLLVDPWITPSVWGGAWTRSIVPIEVDTPDHYVLITHAHGDHFDPVALRTLLAERGCVVCHDAIAPYVASHGFRLLSQPLYEPRRLGEFVVAPVPAADGDGEDQVSWVISGGGRKLFHGGDTMWHGHWWSIAEQYGPFDAAFLPMNGAINRARKAAVDVPSTLTPEQAVAAAEVLRAGVLVPIHYGVNSAVYVEHPDAVAAVRRICRERNRPVQFVAEGASIVWPE